MSKNTKKYRGNLGTKLLFPQNDKNAFTTFLHSTDELLIIYLFNGWQLAKMKKSIPDMSLPWNL